MSTSEDTLDLDNATKAELVEFAEEHGIEVDPSATKAEIIDQIQASEQTQPADDTGADAGDGESPTSPVSDGPTPSEGTTAPGGDVDVLDLPESTSSKDEFPPALYPEDWVVLDGSHEDVPDELDGQLAYVVEGANIPAPDSKPGDPHAALTVDPEGAVTVRARAQGQTLVLPMEAFKEIGRGGRNALVPFA